LWRRIG
jgi:hypothetical protein